jgi:hypothetical protein
MRGHPAVHVHRGVIDIDRLPEPRPFREPEVDVHLIGPRHPARRFIPRETDWPMLVGAVVAAVAVLVMIAISQGLGQWSGGDWHPSTTPATPVERSPSARPPAATSPSLGGAKGDQFDPLRPKIVEMTVGDKWDASRKALVWEITTFPAGTQAIYVAARVDWDAGEGRLIGTMEPVGVQASERPKLSQSRIASAMTTPDDERIYLLTFTAPAKGWAPGDYEIRLTAEGYDLDARTVTVR